MQTQAPNDSFMPYIAANKYCKELDEHRNVYVTFSYYSVTQQQPAARLEKKLGRIVNQHASALYAN